MDLESLQRRQGGIGGSDAAAVLGVPSAFRTQLEVYESKVVPITQEPAEEPLGPRFWGTQLEGEIARVFIAGAAPGAHRFWAKPQTMHRPGVPLVATPDRLLYEGPGMGSPLAGLEVKTADRSKAAEWGESGGDKIPEEYWVQVQHYYMVMPTILYFNVAVLIGGNDYRTYQIKKDDAFCNDLLSAELAWWERHVVPRVPPAATQRDVATLKRLYPGTDGTEVDLSGIAHWHAVRVEAHQKMTAYEGVKDMATAQILAAMGEAAFGRVPGGGRYVRREINRKGYAVEPTSYIDCRFQAAK